MTAGLAPARTTGLTPAQFVPGRLRLRVLSLKGDRERANAVRNTLSNLPGVVAVRINSRTGSLVIEYDTVLMAGPGGSAGLLEALAELFPDFVGNGQIRLSLPFMVGKGELSRRLEESVGNVLGIRNVSIRPEDGDVRIVFDPDRLALTPLLTAIADAAGEDTQ